MAYSDFWLKTPVIKALNLRNIDYSNWTDEAIWRWSVDMGAQLEEQPDIELEPDPKDYETIQMDLIDTPQNFTFRWTGMVGRKFATEEQTYQFDCTISVDAPTLETQGAGPEVFEYEIEWLNGQRPPFNEFQMVDLEQAIREKVFRLTEGYNLPAFI